jgi:hypothetical protein
MSFVGWVTALALFAVSAAGAYVGVVTLVRRRASLPPYDVHGTAAVLLSLVYLAGALASAAALVLLIS